jgi:hypothetical protein
MKQKKAIQLPSGKVAQICYELIFSDKDFKDLSSFNDLRKNAHRLDDLEKMRYAEFTAKSVKPKECAIRSIVLYGEDIIDMFRVRTNYLMCFDDLKFIYAEICSLTITQGNNKIRIPDVVFEEYLPF